MEDQSHSSYRSSSVPRCNASSNTPHGTLRKLRTQGGRTGWKHAVYSGLICTLVMSLLVLGTAFPWLYPKDLEGLVF